MCQPSFPLLMYYKIMNNAKKTLFPRAFCKITVVMIKDTLAR